MTILVRQAGLCHFIVPFLMVCNAWNGAQAMGDLRLIKEVRQKGMVFALQFSPDGKTLVSSTAIGDSSPFASSFLTVFEAATLKQLYGPLRFRNGGGFSFSPDSKTIAAFAKDCPFIEVTTGETLFRMKGECAPTYAGAQWLVSRGEKGLSIYDSQSRKLKRVVGPNTTRFVSRAATAQSDSVVLLDIDGNLYILELPDGDIRFLRRFPWHPVWMRYSHEKQLVFFPPKLHEHLGEIYNIKTGATLEVNCDHYGSGGEFSPGGEELAVCTFSGLLVYDTASGKELSKLPLHKLGAGDVYDDVYSVAYSPDGKLLASGGGWYDRKVKLWAIEPLASGGHRQSGDTIRNREDTQP